jgi:hypothetical protein
VKLSRQGGLAVIPAGDLTGDDGYESEIEFKLRHDCLASVPACKNCNQLVGLSLLYRSTQLNALGGLGERSFKTW